MAKVSAQRKIYRSQIEPLLDQARSLCDKYGFDFLGLVTIPDGHDDFALFGLSNLDIEKSPAQMLLARDCAQENFDRVVGVIENHKKLQVSEFVAGPLDA